MSSGNTLLEELRKLVQQKNSDKSKILISQRFLREFKFSQRKKLICHQFYRMVEGSALKNLTFRDINEIDRQTNCQTPFLATGEEPGTSLCTCMLTIEDGLRPSIKFEI